MNNVYHFLRNNCQSNIPYIKNQILSHIKYQPFIVSKFQRQCKNDVSEKYLKKLVKQYSLNSRDPFIIRVLLKYRHVSLNECEKLNKLVKNENATILHFHYGNDAIIYYPFLKQLTVPSIVSFYGYDYSEFPKSRWGLGKYYLQKYLFPYVTKVIAMSPDMKKDLIQIGCPEKKIIVHYYGTEVRLFNMKRDYNTRKNGIVNFLIISRLVPKKGHLFLLEAFMKAYKYNTKIRLIICGTGPSYKSISNFIKVNHMHYVTLYGRIKYASRKHFLLLKNADIFIHPSLIFSGDKEGIPGTIVEAMAAGLPIISTYHAGIPYVIKHNSTGLLVNSWDTDALTESIVKLASTNKLRKELGLQGQDYALKNLDICEKEKELEFIYESIINSSTRN